MRFTNRCFVGRIIKRDEPIGGLDCQAPCQVPAENILPTDPPMYFCSPHYAVLHDLLPASLARAGLLPPSFPSDSLGSLLDGD